MRKLFLSILGACLALGTFAQVHWVDVTKQTRSNQLIKPADYRTVEVDIHNLTAYLYAAPHENTVSAKASTYMIQLPSPDGQLMTFTLVEAPIMAPELQAQFPDIRAYAGQGVEDPTATLRCSISPKGFNAMVRSASGDWFIDPIAPDDIDTYISYTRIAFYATTEKVFEELPPISNDISIDIDRFENGVEIPDHRRKKKIGDKEILTMGMKTSNGTQLRTYRLALACTGEYAAFHGGTTAGALAAMNTSMVRVNGVYETDVSIRMVLVPNNNLIVYLNAATDPYTNGDGVAMLTQNQTTCNSVIGSANYDIGHVFSTGGGGVANLNSPCTTNKARGVTGSGSPVGDPFDIDYVAHEMGHQFGGNHTQNNSCNRAASAAYEPGSASTIMGYAGICAPNLQSNSDAHFHNKSFNEIITFSVNGTGNTCAAITATGNTPPVVEAGTGGFVIPISTPFELTAVASDANGDALTYCWEEYDLGPATAAGDNNLTNPSGNQPIFRSWDPVTSPTRVFPRIPDLVNNTVTIGEHMPTYDRTLTFRCTVRDNRVNGGGVTDDQIQFTVDNAAGPFVVTAPNTAVNWPANSNQTVTWNVANTNVAPINAPNVDIYLSTDGGYTFPTLVLANTPNDGSQTITIPNSLTTQARIKVKASNSIWFDISNTNFTISAGSGGFALDAAIVGVSSPAGTYCGDTFTPELTVNNLGTTTLTSFTILYNVDGGANQSYNWTGSLASGGSAVITLPSMSAATGAHTFNATVTSPNGGADENTANDSGSSSFSTTTGGTEVTLTILTDCWGEEVSWNIENSSNVILYSQAANTLGDQSTFTWDYCLASGCYEFNIFDSFGDGLDGTASGCAIDGNYNITDSFGNVLVQMINANYGSGTTHAFCVPVAGEPVLGCTDPTACNYDPAANQNDGSCTYPGCTDPLACNYNASAGCSNSSCVYPPVNDVCANATPLTYGVTLATNNTGTCAEGADPSCGGTNIQDVWFSFAYNGGNVSIATALGTNNDTRIALWTACGGTQIACDDDSGPGLASLLNLTCGTLVPGNTYYIQAGGFNAIEGTFSITVTLTNINGCTNPLASNYNACATVDDGSCILPLSGCTNPAACNYNAAATTDDGSCTFPGCNDPAACNYDVAAGCSDGSCSYPGCNDPAACNYNAAAGCSDGSCIYPGCTDNTACNYNMTAGCDDGSCVYPGCTDNTACNYNMTAGCDDGSCVYPGCTDNTACNFDMTAGCDDGSCVYPGCTDNTACNYNMTAGCDDGSCVYPGCTDNTACNYNMTAGCDDGSCVYPGCTDNTACNYNLTAGCDDGSCIYPGCTDNTACNYNMTAGCDDGSCVYPGCMDNTACNYDMTAGCDDGSCVFPGCTDNTACNYDVTAGCDDGSCVYPGCMDNTACNYDPAAGCDDGSCDFSCLGCQGDFNDDGVIGVSDLLFFLSAYGCSSGCGEPDLSGDGGVGASDLLIFLTLYGTTCP